MPCCGRPCSRACPATRPRIGWPGGPSGVDVRYPAEFRFDGLPGAINLPVNEVRGAFGSLDPNREYVVYCQSGRRSSAVAFLLTQQGYQAWWLEGGLWGPLAETKEQ